MRKYYLLVAFLLSLVGCQMTLAQSKVDWKQIKNTPNSFSGYGISNFDFPSNSSIAVGTINAKQGNIATISSNLINAREVRATEVNATDVNSQNGNFVYANISHDVIADGHVYAGTGDQKSDLSVEGLKTNTLTLFPLSEDPSWARLGSLYYNDTEHRIYINENGLWKPLWNSISITPDSIGPGVLDITGPLSVSDGITSGGNITTEGNITSGGNITTEGNITSGGSVAAEGDITSGGKLTVKQIELNGGSNSVIDNRNGKIYTTETIYTPLGNPPSAIKGAVYYNSNDNKLYVYDGSKWSVVGNDIIVDTAMSNTSTHAVQNKVIKTYIDTQDAATLASAKSYADTQDATTLASAKSYADTHDAATLASAKSYADQKIVAPSTENNVLKAENDSALLLASSTHVLYKKNGSQWDSMADKRMAMTPVYPNQVLWDGDKLKRRGSTVQTMGSLSEIDISSDSDDFVPRKEWESRTEAVYLLRNSAGQEKYVTHTYGALVNVYYISKHFGYVTIKEDPPFASEVGEYTTLVQSFIDILPSYYSLVDVLYNEDLRYAKDYGDYYAYIASSATHPVTGRKCFSTIYLLRQSMSERVDYPMHTSGLHMGTRTAFFIY